MSQVHVFRNAVRTARTLQRSQPQMTRSEGIAQVGAYLAEQEVVRMGGAVVGPTISATGLTGVGWITIAMGFWIAMAGKARLVRLSSGVFDAEAKAQIDRIVSEYAAPAVGPPGGVALHFTLALTAVAVQAKRLIIATFARDWSVEASAVWARATSNP